MRLLFLLVMVPVLCFGQIFTETFENFMGVRDTTGLGFRFVLNNTDATLTDTYHGKTLTRTNFGVDDSTTNPWDKDSWVVEFDSAGYYTTNDIWDDLQPGTNDFSLVMRLKAAPDMVTAPSYPFNWGRISGSYQHIGVYSINDGNIRDMIWDGVGYWSLQSNTAPNNAWYTWVSSYDRDGAQFIFWSDSGVVSTQSTSNSVDFTNFSTRYATIGAIVVSFTNVWEGYIAEVQFYDGRAIGEQEAYEICYLADDWLSTGTPIPFRVNYGWHQGFTDTDASNKIGYPFTVATSGSHTMSIDAWYRSAGTTLNYNTSSGQSGSLTITTDSTRYTATISSLTAGADTLWFYATASDSTVIDNLSLTYVPAVSGEFKKKYKEEKTYKKYKGK